MDDFEYSVQISELDWDSFFQACEECNMLPPGLAGLDDSGMSDMDDMANQRTRISTQATSCDPELGIDGPPDCDGYPVELYLSKYGLGSPDQVLSGSEDDFHLEAVNVFFERLKSVSVTEDHTNLGSNMAGHSEGCEMKEGTKEIAASVEILQSSRNQTVKRNDCHSCMYTESTDDDLEIHKSTCPDTELFIREDWSLDVLKEGNKWEAKTRTQPDTERCLCTFLVNGKELTDPNQVKEAKSHLVTSNNSDLLVVQSQASNVTPRRRRRKKKRISVELVEMDPGHEVQLPNKVSDSDEDRYGRRGEMDREFHRAEYCVSGMVSESCFAPHDFLAHAKKNSILENFSEFSQSVSVKRDIRKSTLVSPNLQKELSKDTVIGAQNEREMDKMSDSNLTGKSAETGQLGMKADLKSPEPGGSVAETPQSDDSLAAHTNEDNAGNHLQLTNYFPSEMLASFASTDVSKIEGKPVSIENLVHHTLDIKSQTHSAALISSHNVVCSQTPKSQFEDEVSLSDFQFDGSSAVSQRKTSISCETFPELTDTALFSASYKNTEKKENTSSVTHDEVPYEHKNDDLGSNGSLSESSRFMLLTQADHVNTAQICDQNGHMIQISEVDEIKDDPSAEIMNQKRSKNPAISNTCVNSQIKDWTEENSPSLRLKNVSESQTGINIETVEILSPVIKGDRNEELSLKEQTNEYQSLIHTTEPDSQVSDYSKSNSTLCNILTKGEEQKGQILYVDTSACFSSKGHDLSPTIAVQHSPSPPPTGGAKSLETVDADPISQPTPPVYAISSFWNEMEKLTINDILRLRLVGQAQHTSVLLQPEDSNIADMTDAADSGYFTHSDESKPDHCNETISFLSDFDGEVAQQLSSGTAKVDEGAQDAAKSESPSPTGIIWESDSNLSVIATGLNDVFDLETVHSSSLFRNNSNHCFRKMCKNISVQNLQALEGQNLGKILRNASLHSIHSVYATHSPVEDDYVDPFDRAETSSPVYLSDEEEMDSTGITFSEIFEYLFGTDEPEQSASEADTVDASYLSGSGTSVPEMYDQFFSEFEPENLFYPLADDNSSTNEELVPIFSSSRSASRNVQFPEVYDYFFPDDSPVHSDEDEEPEHAVIRVVTRYDQMPNKNHNSVEESDPYKPIFPEKDNSWNFLWTNPFSFMRIRRTVFTVPAEESSSQTLIPVKNTGRSFREGIQPVNILGAGESPFPDPLILSLENRIFRQLADQKKICSEMQTVVADPSKPHLFLLHSSSHTWKTVGVLMLFSSNSILWQFYFYYQYCMRGILTMQKQSVMYCIATCI